MIDTRLWASVPYNNPTAWTDFVGTHGLWHRALAAKIFQATGATYRIYPISDGGGKAWLTAVQATYRNAAAALGIPPPPDLESYDLRDPGDHASWCFVISTTSRQLALAAGLV